MKTLVDSLYNVLKKLRLDHGLYVASTGNDYQNIWIRDCFYMSLPFLDKDCEFYEKAFHAMLDIFRKYEWKLDIHTKQKPYFSYEYIHPRYSKYDLEEVLQEWGNCQHDAIGAFLWGVGMGERVGKRIIRDEHDRQIIQKLVWYLNKCEYWNDSDNGMWEEWKELHSSSVGACVAGLEAVGNLVDVSDNLILKGWYSLSTLFPSESDSRAVDMSQLSLVYPYKTYTGSQARIIIEKIEEKLLRTRGVIRYQGDSYYSTIEHEGRNKPLSSYYGTEAEWCMGVSWLGLAHLEIGDIGKAREYLRLSRELILPDGSIPELYYSNSDKPNPNTPLGWAVAMHILLEEKLIQS